MKCVANISSGNSASGLCWGSSLVAISTPVLQFLVGKPPSVGLEEELRRNLINVFDAQEEVRHLEGLLPDLSNECALIGSLYRQNVGDICGYIGTACMEPMSAAAEQWAAALYYFLTLLQRLPPLLTTVWVGAHMDLSDLQAPLEMEVVVLAPIVASRHRAMAEQWLESSNAPPGASPVLLEMQVYSAVDLNTLLKHGGAPEEVIVRPFSYFAIRKIFQGEWCHVLTLKEIPSWLHEVADDAADTTAPRWLVQHRHTKRWHCYPLPLAAALEEAYIAGMDSLAITYQGSQCSVDMELMQHMNSDGTFQYVYRADKEVPFVGLQRSAGRVDEAQSVSDMFQHQREQAVLRDIILRAEERAEHDRVNAITSAVQQIRLLTQSTQQKAVEDAVKRGIVDWCQERDDPFLSNTRRWYFLISLILLSLLATVSVVVVSIPDPLPEKPVMFCNANDSVTCLHTVAIHGPVSVTLSTLSSTSTSEVCQALATLAKLASMPGGYQDAIVAANGVGLLLKVVQSYPSEGPIVTAATVTLSKVTANNSQACQAVKADDGLRLLHSTLDLHADDPIIVSCIQATLGAVNGSSAPHCIAPDADEVWAGCQHVSAPLITCPSIAVMAVLVAFFLLFAPGCVAAVALVVLWENRLFGKHGHEQRHATAVMKLLCNHLQTLFLLGKVHLNWPVALGMPLEALNAVFNFDADFSAFNCAFGIDVVGQAAIYICGPFVLLACAYLGIAIHWYRLEYTRGTPTFLPEKLTALLVIIFFMLCPVVLRQLFAVFICSRPEPSALPSDCSVGGRMAIMFFAALMVIIWGVVAPAWTLTRIFQWRNRSYLQSRDAMNRFGLIFAGYQPSRWYWEGVVHLRKIGYCVVLVFGPRDPEVQLQTLLWLCCAALLLNCVFTPFGKDILNRMENFSLGTLSMSMALALTFPHIDSSALRALIAFLFFTANVLCLALFGLVFALRMSTSEALAAASDAWITLGAVWDAFEEEFFKKLQVKLFPRSGHHPRVQASDLQQDKSDTQEDVKELQLRVHSPLSRLSKMSSPLHHLHAQLEPMHTVAVASRTLDLDFTPPLLHLCNTLHGRTTLQEPSCSSMTPLISSPEDPTPPEDQTQNPYAELGLQPPLLSARSAISSQCFSKYAETPRRSSRESHFSMAQIQRAMRPGSGQIHPLVVEPEIPSDPKKAEVPAVPGLRRLGLRAPQNEERRKLTLIASLATHSCQSIYVYYCKQYEVRPKQAVKALLPTTLNDFSLEELTLGQSALIGNRGLLPLLEVVRVNQGLRRLALPGTGVKNSGVEWLVHAVMDHPSITSIDLSDNRITSAAGTFLVYLAQRNAHVTHIDVSQTKIDELLMRHLQSRLNANQEVTSPASTVMDQRTPATLTQPSPA